MYFKKTILAVLMSLFMCHQAQAIDVTINNPDEIAAGSGMVSTIQQNLGKLLTEINAAYNEKREPNISGLPVDEFAGRMIVTLWDSAPFYCDEEEVVDRCWQMKDGYMMRQVPLILDPSDAAFEDTYQEASVEFDKQGRITDFRFSLSSQMRESMEKCGNVASAEQANIMWSLIEQFRTAYCTKDLAFMEKIFSDDALIITGKVIQKKAGDSNTSNAQVVYNRQNKQQYLSNLKRAFLRNKYIDVKFEKIGADAAQGGCGWITQSSNNPNFYGVRLFQKWSSTNYSDEGYVFLLWDFSVPNEPVIQVRTWQPSIVDAATNAKLAEEDIFNISSVEAMIPAN